MRTPNRSSRRSRQGGQALVELALGSLVFVTVLLFGIYFAEVSFLSLKVEEAANSALFDATSAKMHDLTLASGAGRWTRFQANAIAPAGARATERYEDFDGRASQDNGTSLSQALTRAQGLRVLCARSRAVPYLHVTGVAQSALSEEGDSGMLCRAQATLFATRMPRRFLENAPFKVRHLDRVTLRVCAGGRAVGGSCPRGYGILLDDWGFSGPHESRECPLDKEGTKETCSNSGYYDLVRTLYDSNGGSQGRAGSDLAEVVTGFKSPIAEQQFFMSFRGGESDYVERIPSHRPAGREWDTTPAAMSGYHERPGRCWLGHGC